MSSGKKSSSSSSAASIPSKMRETVQNLKEIVNCTEQEIYAMLRECNMEPNETVHRLLTQDTFHEVKSKREKKKEVKVTGESRPQRVTNSNSGRGVRGGADQIGRSAARTSSDDSEVARDKHTHTTENGARVSHTSSVLGSHGTASNSSTLAPLSYSDALGNTAHFPGLSDGTSLPSQPSSTLQQNWLGVPGQLSMADIVKMGRPQQKPSNTPSVAAEVSNSLSHKAVVPNTSQGSARCTFTTVIPLEANQEEHSSQGNVFQVSDVGPEPSAVVSQHESLEEWTLVDHSADESPVLIDVSGGSSVYHEPSASSSMRIDEVDSLLSSNVDDIQKSGHVDGENLPTVSTTSDVQVRVDSFDVSSSFDDGSFRNSSSHQQHEDEDVHEELSSGLQNLNLHREEQGATSTEENPAVIIPGHLQVTNADCSCLSFGSFGSGIGSSFPGTLSKPAKSNLEATSVTENATIDYPDARNPEFYSHEQSRTATDDSVPLITGSSSRNYDVVSASQPERRGENTFISEQPLQYNIPSVSSLAFSDFMQPDYAAYNRVQANPQMQNNDPPTSLTPRTDSAPSSLLAGNDRELPFLHSLAIQCIPTKYNPSMSSLSGPTVSMPEVLKSGLFSNFQPIPQTTSSTTISSRSALHSHLPLPTYSQPTLPLGRLTNMYSYPVLPQRIPYMPFSGSSAFHQSPASLQSASMKYGLPPFKSSMSLNGLPQSLPVGSGYGGFGSSANFPGTFLQNPTNVAAGSAIGYEEALRSQFKESIPLHQGDNSSLWHSRTLPSVPANSFYGLQGPSQQGSSVLQQGQQPTHMGMMGYTNLYNSQLGGVSQEHQQLPSQGNLNVSQGQPSQQSHQLWQNSY